MTVWKDWEALQAFRNSGVHLKAMKDSKKLGFNQSCTWQIDYIPSWEEAIARLKKKSFLNN